MIKSLQKIIGLAPLALPLVALAQTSPQTGNLFRLVEDVQRLLNLLIPIVVTLALLFFIWGLAKFILSAGDEEKKKAGKTMMFWGIIALFVIVAIWGIVEWIANVLGVGLGEGGPAPFVEP